MRDRGFEQGEDDLASIHRFTLTDRRIAAGDRVNGKNRRLEGVSGGGEPR
jgi:hypothetical protein